MSEFGEPSECTEEKQAVMSLLSVKKDVMVDCCVLCEGSERHGKNSRGCRA